MIVDELKDAFDSESCRDVQVYIDDGHMYHDVDKVHIEDEYVVLEYENKNMYAYDFLRAFEVISYVYGLQLCLQQVPNGSGLMFYFIDMNTNQKSGMYYIYINYTVSSRLIEELKKCAKEFKEGIRHKND